MTAVEGSFRYGGHRIAFADYFHEDLARLAPLQADGLVERSHASIRATSRGRLLLRIIAMCFDAFLHRPAPVSAPARYSRAI